MVISKKYYLPGATIPEVFLKADQAINDANPSPEIVKEPIKIPMPVIKGVKGCRPVIITKDWYLKMKKKQMGDIAENSKDAQIEMMKLIAERDRLRYKLGKLNPGKKKDSKMIVNINVKLKDIDAELEYLQEIAGVNIDQLDHGSKLGKFVARLKMVCNDIKKSAKKWYKKHEDKFIAVASVAIPLVLALVAKKLSLLFGL